MTADKRLLWTISFHHLCNDGTLMALIALLPILYDEMDLSYYEIGLLGFGLVITVIVQYGVGKVVDRRFSKYLLEIGAGLMAASFLLMLLVNDFEGLFTAAVVLRFGAAFYHPVGTSWITRAFGGPYLDTALGVQSGVGNLGVIVAWVSSGMIGETYSWRIPCVLWAVMNLAAVVAGFLVIRETGVRPSQLGPGQRTGSRDTLRKIGLLSIPILTGGAIYQVTSYFGPLNLTKGDGWTAGGADIAFAVWIGVGTITSYYFGAICARVDRGPLLKAAYGVSCASLLLLAFVSNWYLVAPLLATFGAFLFLTYPSLFALVTIATDEKERGTAFGILFGIQLGGGAATVYACGMVADALGDPRYSFVIASVMAALSLVALITWESKSGSPKAGTC